MSVSARASFFTKLGAQRGHSCARAYLLPEPAVSLERHLAVGTGPWPTPRRVSRRPGLDDNRRKNNTMSKQDEQTTIQEQAPKRPFFATVAPSEAKVNRVRSSVRAGRERAHKK